MRFIYEPRDQPPLSAVGGKAAALAFLIHQGFPVPAFLMVTSQAFSGDNLTPGAKMEIARRLAELGPGPFAVRSSAVEEDGAAHSHAGQFLSLLGIEPDDVPEAVEKVWQSGARESVQAYRSARGLAGGGRPAVIIQKQVRARAAGVLFTADPVKRDPNRIVISGVAGLGDKLVGGEADGDDYVVAKSDGRMLAGPEAGVLSATDLRKLHEMACRAEAVFGKPQDMEWAFDEEALFVLQSRPITTAIDQPAAGDDVIIFDNSNIIESYPGVVAPLTYSFAQYAYARVYRMFVRMIGVSETTIAGNAAVFENMLGRLDGRVYYNLLNWYRVLAMLPGFALNRAHMETMMGVSEPLPDEIANMLITKPKGVAGRLGEYGRMARGIFRLIAHAFGLKRMIAGFYQRLNQALARPASSLDAMPLSELAREYRRIELSLLDRWDAPLINDFLCMMAFGASRKLMGKWAGEAGIRLHSDILIGQGDIISAEPARLIREMGQLIKDDASAIDALAAGDASMLARHGDLDAQVRRYIDKFGDRCTEELKLESLSLNDDPAPLLKAIAASARSPAQARPRGGDPLAQIRSLFAGKPVKAFLARRLMTWTKNRVRDRENLRFERTRIFGRARRLFLTCGERLAAQGLLAEKRDIMFLTVQEILGTIEGFAVSTDLKGLAALRKQELQEAARHPDPPERVTIAGAATGFARAAHAVRPASSSDRQRQGTGCSAGLVTAIACVVEDPRQQIVKPGEILVARHTDPGWIAAFSNASAIIVERGSLLSHSAIVARELGIPCVVGLKGAMHWIRTGEQLTVDGATGQVSKTDAQ
ncbi:PEP/pyruvate-binding domain-containing protein [Taklimakanibacter lacteus]|uniref:PEP/pyruvate-binding domain-containing protein n=1 Tax=Taklimakanibacter lacteus TaxID=2268456 RepID=UPI000E66B951